MGSASSACSVTSRPSSKASSKSPTSPISLLPLLTEAERSQILVDFNDTKTDYPREACIHTRFEEQATHP